MIRSMESPTPPTRRATETFLLVELQTICSGEHKGGGSLALGVVSVKLHLGGGRYGGGVLVMVKQ